MDGEVVRPAMPATKAGGRVGSDSARKLLSRLIWLYQGGCFSALLVTLLLALLGLEFTFYQWAVILAMVPLVVAFYNLVDVWLLRRQARPIMTAFRALDQGGRVADDILASAMVRALNLPLLSFLRVTFFHGPLVTLLVIASLLTATYTFGAGVTIWQVSAFAATTLLFASPAHAIFEYFGVSRAIVSVVVRLNHALAAPLAPAYQRRLFAVRLRSKLLYLAIFVASMPLTFVAVSVAFKVQRLLVLHHVQVDRALLLPLYAWLLGSVAVCIAGVVVLALLTANEVSRSAANLIAAMRAVEDGRFEDLSVEIVSTDEYADIFRGFRQMVDVLREEQRILAISHDLAGELQLDLLIARIMRSTSDLLHAERSTLFLHDAKTDELYSIYADGEHIQQIRIPADRGIAGAVFASGRPENIADVYADPRFDRATDRRTGFQTRSMLCAPIANTAGGRIGVTQVLNRRDGLPFSTKDEARLRAFSAQIAMSLENAKLFDEVLSIKNYNDSILKSTSNGIITLDADHAIVTANDAALRLVASQREALIGKRISAAFVGENAWVADSFAAADLVTETSLAVDAEIHHADARSASINLSAAPLIDATEDRIGSMLILEDITSEKRVRTTMARYMNKEVADQLLKEGEDALIGQDQTVSILFSDLRGFTTMSEQLSARQTVAMLNDYFTEMVDVILNNDGILDKYIGDAMMALFGAPFPGPLDADNAIAAACEMMAALEGHNATRASREMPPLEIGIGIATGDVVVGNIGSLKRMDYTVIGDSVNLASRLEGANKFYGTRILFSELTRSKLSRPILSREVDLIRPKGKHVPVAVHEALEHRTAGARERTEAMLAHYKQGLAFYREGAWRDAQAVFGQALATLPGDGPSLLYLERCTRFVAEPPAADWDGVWTLSSK